MVTPDQLQGTVVSTPKMLFCRRLHTASPLLLRSVNWSRSSSVVYSFHNNKQALEFIFMYSWNVFACMHVWHVQMRVCLCWMSSLKLSSPLQKVQWWSHWYWLSEWNMMLDRLPLGDSHNIYWEDWGSVHGIKCWDPRQLWDQRQLSWDNRLLSVRLWLHWHSWRRLWWAVHDQLRAEKDFCL